MNWPCQGYRRHVNSPLGSESETTDDNEVTHHDEEKGKHFPEEEEDQVGMERSCPNPDS